jgi:homoserine/homoserine lactone efflux protein
MGVQSWLGFAALIAIATCSPGPNVLTVITNALRHGWRGAGLAITGNLVALFVIALAAALGTGAVLRAFPSAYQAMKLAGAAYLIWVGINLLRVSFSAIERLELDPEEASHRADLSIVLHSLLVSLSNPKSILFLSAVFPSFLDHAAPIAPQFAVMFVTIIAIVGLIHASYAAVSLRLRARLLGAGGRRWMGRVAGFSFAGLGVGLAADAARS